MLLVMCAVYYSLIPEACCALSHESVGTFRSISEQLECPLVGTSCRFIQEIFNRALRHLVLQDLDMMCTT